MSENEKRRRSFKLKLYIHNKNSGGFLEFIRDGIKVYVSIEARFVRIIKIYLNKYNADIKRFPERICGFIKDDELEKLYSSGPLQIPVEVSSFPTYRSRIQKKINDEFELLNLGIIAPRLFLSKRFGGNKLAYKIEIVDLSD